MLLSITLRLRFLSRIQYGGLPFFLTKTVLWASVKHQCLIKEDAPKGLLTQAFKGFYFFESSSMACKLHNWCPYEQSRHECE